MFFYFISEHTTRIPVALNFCPFCNSYILYCTLICFDTYFCASYFHIRRQQNLNFKIEINVWEGEIIFYSCILIITICIDILLAVVQMEVMTWNKIMVGRLRGLNNVCSCRMERKLMDWKWQSCKMMAPNRYWLTWFSLICRILYKFKQCLSVLVHNISGGSW